MRIVIDMQGAQTESRFLGIGRYTLSFAQAVVRNRGEHEVLLALNGLLPDTIEPIRAAFDGLLPQENIRVWQAPGPVRELDPANGARREVAELMREAFLASLQADVIHVSSLFEGYKDDAVTSIRRLDRQTLVSVSLYDLIPLLNPDQYLKPNPTYAAYYERKVSHLRQADTFLAISEHARQEGLQCLGVDAHRIVNVSTAIESKFQPVLLGDAEKSALLQKLGVSRPFVFHTGGSDERNNLPRLLEAWSTLPTSVRHAHQLLIVGRMYDRQVNDLKKIAKVQGLADDELIVGGYVSDDALIHLYNLCKLFVLPSCHLDFGLQALEAMACGAAVIGANTSSLPEVIGLEEALFDPLSVEAISNKIASSLNDGAFTETLKQHGQAHCKRFSWDTTARRALEQWVSLCIHRTATNELARPYLEKPRLAFVSPLPPQRTGIADYSAELLLALAAHYEIELIVDQEQNDASWSNEPFPVRNTAWLRANAKNFDRVLYQMGNSPFHKHMISLLEEIPGMVVLHDFYLSGLMAWLEQHGDLPGAWSKALYESHGYIALRDSHLDAENAIQIYPVNWHILKNAKGVIVHSEFARTLANQWYGSHVANKFKVIPLLRSSDDAYDKKLARKQLGIKDQDFVVCSFGFLNPNKLNHRLLDAWLRSTLAADRSCHLFFVGENHGGAYGSSLTSKISSSYTDDRIRVTGFTSQELFKQYLAAADLAVQLRTNSRGETSAAVLDSMNNKLPLIINGNGSMVELNPEAVWMLPDEFTDEALVEALETLWHDPDLRDRMGDRARKIIREQHAPNVCAQKYMEAIEHAYQNPAANRSTLIKSMVAEIRELSDDQLWAIAHAMSRNIPENASARRMLLDVTGTATLDRKTGIERVVRGLLKALLDSPPSGYRIEPVYLSNKGGYWCYRRASQLACGVLDVPAVGLVDEVMDASSGDILITMDLSGDALIQAHQSGLYNDMRNRGVAVHAVVYDLLPVLMPDVFPHGADATHARWLQAVSSFDGAVCISRAVADELVSWRRSHGILAPDRRPYKVGWFHLGADVDNSVPSRGLPPTAQQVLDQLSARVSFLMVGTVEPRKGHLQVIEAFHRLWQQGLDVNLVVVGKEGWKDLPDSIRRNIPSIEEQLHNHPEAGKHLFWLEGISDEYLEKVYAASTCLIAASYGEGFGLPLIEAAQHKIPIIARDIPVFREVAGPHAFYFDSTSGKDLSDSITVWLTQYKEGQHPRSDDMPWLNWKQSANQLNKILFNN